MCTSCYFHLLSTEILCEKCIAYLSLFQTFCDYYTQETMTYVVVSDASMHSTTVSGNAVHMICNNADNISGITHLIKLSLSV